MKTKSATSTVEPPHVSTPSQTLLESLTGAVYRLEAAASHILFSLAPRRAVELARRSWDWFGIFYQDGGHARRRLTNFAGICLGRVIRPMSGDPLGRPANSQCKINPPTHMKTNTNTQNAPDASATDTTTTPAIILQGLIGIFSEPGGNHADRTAALELDMLLMLDASAERDLLKALFGDCQFDASTPAGMTYMLDVLKHVGAVEVNSQPITTSEIFGLKFHARPLLDLLKAMPHREGGMGLSLDLVEDCTIEN